MHKRPTNNTAATPSEFPVMLTFPSVYPIAAIKKNLMSGCFTSKSIITVWIDQCARAGAARVD
jgi:hypothetical protein